MTVDSTIYHGTRADLQPGDLIGPGYYSNQGQRRYANLVYFSATLDARNYRGMAAVRSQ